MKKHNLNVKDSIRTGEEVDLTPSYAIKKSLVGEIFRFNQRKKYVELLLRNWPLFRLILNFLIEQKLLDKSD